MKENEIALKCRENDEQGWNMLYETFGNRMKSLCRRYLKNEADVDDTVSECFVKIFENIGRYSERGSFSGWIMSLTRNEAVNRLRKNAGIVLVPMDDCPDFPVESTERNQDLTELGKIADEMPGYLMRVFEMRRDGLKFKDIAGRLSISESTAKVYFLRARRWLVKKIEKNYGNLNFFKNK